MSIWGKLIGGATGLALGGPLGAILGVAAGHGVDKVSNYNSIKQARVYSNEEKEKIFATGVISLAAKISKVDGKVTVEEISTFKKIFEFPKEDEKNISKIFNSAKENVYNYDIIAKQVFDAFKDDKNLLVELLNSLFAIAYADGKLHKNEEAMLIEISKIMNIGNNDLDFIKSMYANKSKDNKDNAKLYYKILGVSEENSLEEITKKYKSLIKEYHPDRLQGLGLPEDFIKLANEKLSSINEAYNFLKNEKTK